MTHHVQTGRLWATLLLAGLVACDNTVHIRLSDGGDPLMAQECGLAAAIMGSFYVELAREGDDQELIFRKCVDLPGGAQQPRSLGQLEQQLAGRIVFDDVPTGQSWVLWVEGFGATDCRKMGAPLLCGQSESLSLPPDDGNIVVGVSCVAPKYFTWTSESLQTCRVK